MPASATSALSCLVLLCFYGSSMALITSLWLDRHFDFDYDTVR